MSFVRCRLCNGRGGSHIPRMPSHPKYLESWPWVDCEVCLGTGIDKKATDELKEVNRIC